ncbi:phosphoglycerate kinase [Candidatus Geothermarchaeota archaeon ex4572_27]|nr:MAG: phosphoglycerate kinase [Candidatus Geothermarchaeota archaeon ex4572_27]
MIDYYSATRPFWLVNLAEQLKTPTLVRVDINVPVVGGRIVEDSLRLRVYGEILGLMAQYAGLVVVAHQGRRGGKDFISLEQHCQALRKYLPKGVEIEFVPFSEMYSERLRERIKSLDTGKILLLDNIRMDEEETKFDPQGSRFISFFKGLVARCVNDAFSVWHRSHTSVMALPYIAETYVGLRSIYELKVLREVLGCRREEAAVIVGGAKMDKAEYLLEIPERMECFTGGLIGQAAARAKGYDLGPENNRVIESKVSPEMFDLIRRAVEKYNIRHPIDFVVRERGEDIVYTLGDVSKARGPIMDIGPETVDRYAEELSGMLVKIRAGPLGVYEEGYANGVNLTRRIAGSGLIFLGGDTTAELARFSLEGAILSSGGVICLGGGAFLHGLAGRHYPSIDLLIGKGKP